MHKKLKDSLTIKDKVSKFKDTEYSTVEVYYRDMQISNSLWLVNGNNYVLVQFLFYDFRKYFGFTEKELMKMMIEYLRNEYGAFIKISHMHELRFKLANIPDINDLLT